MFGNELKYLLDQLKLTDSDTVFSFKQREWRSFVPRSTQNKLDIIEPTAFYVFDNLPYILFFDLSSSSYSKEKENEIHKQVWSFDQSPVTFIIKDGNIEVYNAFAYEKKASRLEKINVPNEKLKQKFSFWNLQSGNTWKWLQEDYYQKNIKEKRVSQKLFENIKLVREYLIQSDISDSLSDDEANTLILRLIFIRYLIDRNVRLDKTYIEGNTILERRQSFIELISRPKKLNEFFSILNEKFNGVLFKDTKASISQSQANNLTNVFSGEIPEKGTLFFGSDFYFEVFDFSIISVELISGIYESLIDPETKKLDAAVYTPSFLVEHILSNSIDKFFEKKENGKKTECKIFDPSVGSGIFLVQSFRRMVDRENKFKKIISKERLSEIVQNNLFGIDINQQALKVACFSIYIAMLDYQDPKTILDDFRFPKLLGETLFVANYFDESHLFNKVIVSNEVDFILGNPPWKADNSSEHLLWINSKQYFSKKITGKFEIAQSFLLRSKYFMHPKTVSALVVTSTIFYNISSTTKEFKQRFLTDYCIDCFFDLSPVRRLIFEEKNNPCAIVYYYLSDGKSHLDKIIRHRSIKSNIFLKYYKTLVIEKFDQKEIPQKNFIVNDWMFKAALYGSFLDFSFLSRLERPGSTIKNIVDSKIDFAKGDGIYKGSPKKHFDFLINKPVIETEAVKFFYTNVPDDVYILKKDDVFLESGRKEGLFDGELILLKHRAKDENDLVISFSDKPVVFRHGVYGITTKTKSDELKLTYGILLSKVFTYYQFLTSSAWGIATRPEVKLEEYLSFPFSTPSESDKSIIIGSVNNILSLIKKWYIEFKLGLPPFPDEYLKMINKVVDKVYQISTIEEDLIDFVLDIGRYQFQESKQGKVFRKVHNNSFILEKYANVFLSELQDIYEHEHLKVDIYTLDYFVAMNFTLLKEKPNDTINIINTLTDESKIFGLLATSISITQIAKDLYVQKDIKGFEENSFYIIKPNEYKCWHRAMAWHDVAEIKEAIEAAEVDYLNQSSDAS